MTTPMTDEQLDAFFESAFQALERKQDALTERFGLGLQEEWKADLATGTIRFITDGRDVAHADLVVVGTLGREGAWQWGWANAGFPDDVRAASEALKGLAATTGLDIFEEPRWEAGEAEAWEMTALACDRFGGDGAYCMPGTKADVFAVLRNVRAVA